MTDDTDTTLDERIVEALWTRREIVLTASHLADELDAHRTTVLDHLRELEADGRVASIEVGARAVGWYLPGDVQRLDWTYLIPTYHDYVHRPVDKRGRLTVGAKYADMHLTLAILESPAYRTVSPSEWAYESPMKWHHVAEILDDDADESGRVKVGPEWAGKEISVAVLEAVQ